MSEIGIALSMVVVAAALVGLFLWYKAHGSERRMMHMLHRCGLQPDIARQRGYTAVIGEARRRCRKCQAEAVCERWLNGELVGQNDFCPNASVFERLKYASRV